jgi:hypothetical protein
MPEIKLTRQRIKRLGLSPTFFDTDEKMIKRIKASSVDDYDTPGWQEIWTVIHVDNLIKGEIDQYGLQEVAARVTETRTVIV